ncbi:MAG: uroporphyrinogen-III C-methyltransferase, partial [Planctomycetota bacterium]
MSEGKVYLVGAGPGDAGLITLKGCQLISQADVILHDHLIPSELLRLARPAAEVISVGKFASQHTMSQPDINNLLVEKAKSGHRVVRLKGGDPFLFGRGGEEAEACAEAGVEFEVVPGVTSALAVPSYAGIPPTHRDYTPNVAIVTGHRKGEQQLEIPKAGTIVFLMGVANIRKIVASLLDAGWLRETKIAAIENGTCYNQRVVTGTLENFVEIIQAAALRTPAVFIVGKVVELREKLGWFDGKPTVLVLGIHPEKYAHLGNIVHRPLIDCVGLEDYSGADSVLRELKGFGWVAFTSANAIRFFFERL